MCQIFAGLLLGYYVALYLGYNVATRPGFYVAEISEPQKTGRAAYFLVHQAILVPSFRTSGASCVIFSERVDLDQLHEKSSQPI